MMPEIWTRPKDADVLQAVKDAVDDLDALQNELIGKDRSYTTGERFMHVDYWGTRGATRKRQAEVEFLTGVGDWRVTLGAAQADYEQGLQAGYSDHWILGQWVVLRTVLASAAGVGHRPPDRRWEETCRAVRLGMDSGNPHEQMWAWSSLADLRMVALREDWPLEGMGQSVSVRNYLEAMVNAVGGPDQCAALWPTFRQFWRWKAWWRDPAWEEAAAEGYEYLWTLVRPALDILPRTVAVPPDVW
jgi:hypothetical protein